MLSPAHLLRSERLATWLTARPAHLAIVICAVWVLAGLIGHDPWKSDEAYTFGAVYRMLLTGDWVVPTVAGEPSLDSPPLVDYSAALSGFALSPIMPLHDAARVAVGLWTALLLLFTALTARELWGGNRTWVAPLMLIGCAGLLVRAHQLIGEVVLLAALAMGLYGLALAPRRSQLGGVWLGIGFGLAVFASGLYQPLMLMLTTIGMVAVSPRYRTLRFGKSALTAALVAIPLALAWPLMLHSTAPELFSRWLSENLADIGGLFLFRRHEEYFYFLNALPWYAWPAWLFALWSLWVEGREGLAKRELQLPLVALVAIFGFLSLSGEGRDVLAMPMLLPLSLLASIALGQLPRGATNAFYWFGIMVVTVFTIVVWVYFCAIQFGVPRELADHLFDQQPAYEAQPRVVSTLIAIVFTVLWFVLVFNLKRSAERPVILWAAGVTIGWTLAVLLLFHWIDSGKSYRSMVVELRKAMPQKHGCILSQGLGDPQRAMLDYFGQITTKRLETAPDRHGCNLLITQDRWSDTSVLGAPWELTWEGSRPGDKLERFRLYKRMRP